MENSDRGSKVSKDEVEVAVMLLQVISGLGLLGLMVYLSNLVLFHPDKLEEFGLKIETALAPFLPLFNSIMQVLMFALGIVLVGIIAISLRIIWKGREHLSDVLNGDDK